MVFLPPLLTPTADGPIFGMVAARAGTWTSGRPDTAPALGHDARMADRLHRRRRRSLSASGHENLVRVSINGLKALKTNGL